MPPKSKGKEKLSSSANPAAPNQRVQPSATVSPRSAMLVAPSHPPLNPGPPSFPASRPRLPPLSHLQTQSASHITPSPYSAPLAPYSQTSPHDSPGPYAPSGTQWALPRLSTDPRAYGGIPLRPTGPEYPPGKVPSEPEYPPALIGRSRNPLKRGPEYAEFNTER